MNDTDTAASLGEHFTRFVEDQVGQGRYRDAGEVVRAGLRLLEEREATLAAIRDALVEGEQSGVSDRSVADIWTAVKGSIHGTNGPL